MTIRCKFQVTWLKDDPASTPDNPIAHVTLTTQYDTSIPEDQRFTKYTPSGNLNFVCTNPAVLSQLKVGQNYYLDLTPCG